MGYTIVPAFFTLSGFLIANSLLRHDILSFAALRMIRIYPALIFEVLLSAFVIGAVFTTLPLTEYYSDPMFFDYMLNIGGWIHYSLPGVFDDLPNPGSVNIQLWTIPYELFCYLGLALAAPLRLHRHRWLFLASVAALILGLFAFRLGYREEPEFFGRPSGWILVMNFLAGVAIYLVRDHIPLSFVGFLISITGTLGQIWHYHTEALGVPFIAYATIYVAFINVRVPGMRALANQSYGLYLYGYPVQQTVCAVFPDHRQWWFNLLVSLPLTLALAWLSWILVEKPLLNRRRAILGALARLRATWTRPAVNRP